MTPLPLTISGRVVTGAGSARRFGYPTANLDIASLDLAEGIYLGHASCAATKDAPCLIFYGMPHALPEITKPRCEVHLLDRSLDLYDKTITIHIETFVRENKKFSTDDELSKAIAADFTAAKKYFGLQKTILKHRTQITSDRM